MKKALFNITVYTMLAWSILSAVYISLPADIQALLPQMNWLTAVISGGSTALVGSGGLAVRAWLDNARKVSDEKLSVVAGQFLTLVNKYNELSEQVNKMTEATAYNNRLLTVELQTKLTNPMIADSARQLITQVLPHDGQE